MDGALYNENVDTQELKDKSDIKIIHTSVVKDEDLYPGQRVYLTFDDGPSDNTDAILDKLAEYNVKATFFVVMNTDEESIQRYKRIVNEGHTLGIRRLRIISWKLPGSVRYFTVSREVQAIR